MTDYSPVRAGKAPDEVDLVEVFISIVRFFKKNGLILLLSTAFGLGLGGIYYKLKSKVYGSKMVAECMSLPDGRVVDLILVLDNLREQEGWVQLGKILGITPKEASLIKKLEPLSSVTVDKEAKGVDDYLLPTHQTSYLFSVILKVKDNAILPKVQKGIVNYLATNEYSQIRVNRFIENRTRMVTYLNSEMRKLDSLNGLYATKVVNSKSSESTLTSPGDYKAIMVNLEEKRQMFEDELRFASPVRVIQGFTAFPNPMEPDLILVFGMGLLGGFVLGLIIVIFKSLVALYNSRTAIKA